MGVYGPAANLIVNVSSNGSNSVMSAATIQTGWGYAQGTGTTFANATITYPVAYANTPVYIQVSPIGYKDASSPSGPTDITGPWEALTPTVYSASTTTASVRQGASGATIVNTRYVLFSWLSIGV